MSIVLRFSGSTSTDDELERISKHCTTGLVSQSHVCMSSSAIYTQGIVELKQDIVVADAGSSMSLAR